MYDKYSLGQRITVDGIQHKSVAGGIEIRHSSRMRKQTDTDGVVKIRNNIRAICNKLITIYTPKKQINYSNQTEFESIRNYCTDETELIDNAHLNINTYCKNYI